MMTRLTLRLDFPGGTQLGPGKVRLLELVAEHGSISAAGRAMGMSYRRAWLLIDALNHHFREPLVTTQLGGSGGGGAVLTPFGQTVIERYRAIEAASREAARAHLEVLEAALSETLGLAAPSDGPAGSAPGGGPAGGRGGRAKKAGAGSPSAPAPRS